MKLSEKYIKEIKPALISEFGIKNPMSVPKITKIIVNMGIGDALKNKEAKEKLITDLAAITGQKPSERQARVSIASFSIRKGNVVGISSTLRKEKMYDFFQRFVSVVLPRLRDFRGVKDTSFDNNGNYSIGLSEHTVFPEIDSTKSAQAHGMEITITTTAKNKEQAKRLLELLGMPFVKES